MDLSRKILSDIIIHMKYAKYLPESKRRETWEEIVDRNKNMHKRKFIDLPKHFHDALDKAYEYVYNRKVLPSMRSMQFAGKPIETSPNRIYNCAFLPVDDYRAFSEIMFLLLGGCGVGFSVQKHHVENLPDIKHVGRNRRYLIGDSIEGWADAVKALMKAYLLGKSMPVFDFSDIRPKGALLVTSGGKAPGPEPLKECLFNIKKILDRKEVGDQLEPIEVHDIVCFIADAVLAGGIRRAALISLFSLDDSDMLSSKFGAWYEENPQRGRANNSAVVVRHRVTKEDFDELWGKVKESGSGEPGIFFTNDTEWGTNPCAEISLRPFQFCNLVEINANDIESRRDFLKRCWAATFIATLQASYTDFHYLRDIWKRNTEKDALIGVSQTGIASNLIDTNDSEAVNVIANTNRIVAKEIGINQAQRRTTVKPSGTSSIVLGCSSGIHPWHDKFYIRRVRVGKNEAIYKHLSTHHPELIEDCFFKPEIEAVISIPQKAPSNAETRDSGLFSLLSRVISFNRGWITWGHLSGNNKNNVSVTLTVKEDEWDKLGEELWRYRNDYNGISVLPYDGHTYKQAPFESITEEEYERLYSNLREFDPTTVSEEQDETNLTGEVACSGGACEII